MEVNAEHCFQVRLQAACGSGARLWQDRVSPHAPAGFSLKPLGCEPCRFNPGPFARAEHARVCECAVAVHVSQMVDACILFISDTGVLMPSMAQDCVRRNGERA